MATIYEDYVSFETAKLLKEKGFPQSTFRCHYLTDGSSYYKIFENRCGFGDNNIIAPTLAMAMKWLREVHNIFIEVSVSIDLNGKYHYSYSILNKECKCVRKGYTSFDWDYNQACETAIKYSLENLI